MGKTLDISMPALSIWMFTPISPLTSVLDSGRMVDDSSLCRLFAYRTDLQPTAVSLFLVGEKSAVNRPKSPTNASHQVQRDKRPSDPHKEAAQGAWAASTIGK